MPTYEYKCNKCGETFERIAVPYESRDDQVCAICKEPVVRQFSAPALHGFDRFGKSK